MCLTLENHSKLLIIACFGHFCSVAVYFMLLSAILLISLQVVLSAFDKDASLDVLDHPVLNLIYYLVRSISTFCFFSVHICMHVRVCVCLCPCACQCVCTS